MLLVYGRGDSFSFRFGECRLEVVDESLRGFELEKKGARATGSGIAWLMQIEMWRRALRERRCHRLPVVLLASRTVHARESASRASSRESWMMPRLSVLDTSDDTIAIHAIIAVWHSASDRFPPNVGGGCEQSPYIGAMCLYVRWPLILSLVAGAPIEH